VRRVPGLDQLSALDAAFLRLETPSSHMHVAWVALFRPHPTRPRPTAEALRSSIAGRLRHLPRCRQRLVYPPGGLGEPFWVDDPSFDIARHVIAPTGPDEAVALASFDRLVDALLSEPLDRSRPLWQFTLVPRLDDGRIGLVCRLHHAMVDGVAAIELGSILFDASADATVGEFDDWTAADPPDAAALTTAAVRSQLDLARRSLGVVGRAAREPRRTAGTLAGKLARVLASVREDVLSPAPPSYLNTPTGAARRLVRFPATASDVLAVKRAAGVTFNDVCVAVVAGTLRELAVARFESPVPLRAAVPVSLRPGDDRETTGNRIAFAFAELPADAETPRERLVRVHEQTQRFKRAGRADAAELATSAIAFVPPPLKAPLARFAAGGRFFNVVVSNVPGPRTPFYLLGATVDEGYPVAPLAEDHALAIAFFSYGDGVYFGCLADPHALPDVDELPRLLEAELEALRQEFAPPRPPLERRPQPGRVS
jgi:diacylglycerol O-acyltransferase / wax synthase